MHHAGGDIDHADWLADHFKPQHPSHHAFGEFRRAIPGPAFIRFDAGGGGDDEHGAAGFLECGQQLLRHTQRAEHVELIHGPPVVDARGGDRILADGPARAVDERCDRPAGENRVNGGLCACLICDVGGDRFDRIPQFLRQRVEPFGTTGERDHLPSIGDERAYCRRSDTAGCSGDDRAFHCAACCRCCLLCHDVPFCCDCSIREKQLI